MEYFKILNLTKEPFSNSPEPELFYESKQHVSCLQKLELSIRLRRGLNVVIGDVGTGKTTLCRQLIRNFSTDEKDRKDVGIHLILDPSFSTPVEFLRYVARTFDVDYSIRNSEFQLKEKIKNYLFTKGVDEGKTVVIIIDEGQKIPLPCMEVLREFLNYETNECKLLQIIIFAQKEFEPLLKAHANISDRINLYYILGPLNIMQTKAMIDYRLRLSGLTDPRLSLFTLPGLLAVYFMTGGYPRKIITLCHLVVLAMIIQNKSRAGLFLVWSCARRGLPPRALKIRWVTAGVAAMVFAGLVAGWASYDREKSDKGGKSAQLETASITERIPDAGLAEKAVQQDTAAERKEKTEAGENPALRKHANIEKIGKAKPVEAVTVKADGNYPTVTTDQTLSGDIKKSVPAAVPVIQSSKESGLLWVEVFASVDAEETKNVISNYPKSLPAIRLVTYRNQKEGVIYAVMLDGSFKDRAAVDDKIWMLKGAGFSNVKIIDKWMGDKAF